MHFLKALSSGKEPTCQCRQCMRRRFDPWVRKIPCRGTQQRRRTQQSIPVFLHGESHGQKSLVGQSSQGRKELDMTETTQHSTQADNSKYNKNPQTAYLKGNTQMLQLQYLLMFVESANRLVLNVMKGPIFSTELIKDSHIVSYLSKAQKIMVSGSENYGQLNNYTLFNSRCLYLIIQKCY